MSKVALIAWFVGMLLAIGLLGILIWHWLFGKRTYGPNPFNGPGQTGQVMSIFELVSAVNQNVVDVEGEINNLQLGPPSGGSTSSIIGGIISGIGSLFGF